MCVWSSGTTLWLTKMKGTVSLKLCIFVWICNVCPQSLKAYNWYNYGMYTLGTSLLHPGMRYLFGNYSYSICLWDLKAGWLAKFMFILCIVCLILLNGYCGKFVMTFIDIGEIGCMSIPKCHWVVSVVNLVKQTWIFACWYVFHVCWASIGHSRL